MFLLRSGFSCRENSTSAYFLRHTSQHIFFLGDCWLCRNGVYFDWQVSRGLKFLIFLLVRSWLCFVRRFDLWLRQRNMYLDMYVYIYIYVFMYICTYYVHIMNIQIIVVIFQPPLLLTGGKLANYLNFWPMKTSDLPRSTEFRIFTVEKTDWKSPEIFGK